MQIWQLNGPELYGVWPLRIGMGGKRCARSRATSSISRVMLTIETDGMESVAEYDVDGAGCDTSGAVNVIPWTSYIGPLICRVVSAEVGIRMEGKVIWPT